LFLCAEHHQFLLILKAAFGESLKGWLGVEWFFVSSFQGEKMDISSHQTERLLEMIAFYRGLVLDACEADMGNSPNWKFLRSRLLKLFGEKGMEQKVLQIMGFADQEGGVQ
jgi:hypothetical protein